MCGNGGRRAELNTLREAVDSKNTTIAQLTLQLQKQSKVVEEVAALRDEVDILRPKAAALDKAEVT